MKRNKHKTSNAGQSLVTAITAGVVGAICLSVLLTLFLTNFVLNGTMREENANVIILLIRAISVFAGALIGGALLKQRYLLQVSLTALGYWVALIGIGIVFYDGSFKHFLSGTASVLTGGAAALMLLQRPKRKSRRPHKYNL